MVTRLMLRSLLQFSVSFAFVAWAQDKPASYEVKTQGVDVKCAPSADGSHRPHAGMLRFPDVSATQLVFVYANDIWVVPREGGSATPLASPPGLENFPRFSPDGRIIAFVGNYE